MTATIIIGEKNNSEKENSEKAATEYVLPFEEALELTGGWFPNI